MILWDYRPPAGDRAYSELYAKMYEMSEKLADEDHPFGVCRSKFDVFDHVGSELGFEWDLIDVEGICARGLIACCNMGYRNRLRLLISQQGQQLTIVPVETAPQPENKPARKGTRRRSAKDEHHTPNLFENVVQEEPETEQPKASNLLIDLL